MSDLQNSGLCAGYDIIGTCHWKWRTLEQKHVGAQYGFVNR